MSSAEDGRSVMALHMVRFGAALKIALLALVLGAGPGPVTAASGCRIAVLGDSLASGYGLRLEDAFPARLEAAVHAAGYPCEVLDAGVSGDTSAGGRSRLDWTLGDGHIALCMSYGNVEASVRARPSSPSHAAGALLRVELPAR